MYNTKNIYHNTDRIKMMEKGANKIVPGEKTAVK